jgi:hypothetical protein
MTTKQVSYNQITPSNFRCGDVIGGNDGNQYEITDAEKGKAILRQLSADECVKAEYLHGKVTL